MKLVLWRREIYPRAKGILRKNIPNKPAFLNLSGYSFLRERCMGQWMSRTGACVKHFRARRVVKRDVPGTAKLMGREWAVLESALPLLGVRMGFV